jgi:ATP-binding cassette subfamily B protein
MTFLGLTSSFFIQALVDFVFVLGRIPALNWLGLGMLLVSLARVSFLGLRSYPLAHLNQRVDAETMHGYHRHLLGLPLTFFYSHRIRDSALIESSRLDSIRIHFSADRLLK